VDSAATRPLLLLFWAQLEKVQMCPDPERRCTAQEERR
jgi:hypothetical protein